MRPIKTRESSGTEFDVVVVGAGFSGLYMLHRLRQEGLSARVLEAGSDIGGTWFWNKYPGARCDIESLDYQYSFSDELLREWKWTERYATQPEILAYLGYVADRFGLREDIELGTRVASAVFDESASQWAIQTETGERYIATYCVMAVGCLSSVKRPDFPGLEAFEGDWYHTARWPAAGVDFTGKRVGVVGTGSTAIQAVPRIAEQASTLYVFQRTANYSMPAQNRPLTEGEIAEVLNDYRSRRRDCEWSDAGVPFPPPERAALEVGEAERRSMYEAGWRRGGINALSYAFTDFFTDEAANRTAQDFAREKIRGIVHDRRTADLLSPRQHIGTKRTCVDTGYFETFNRDNVRLVDISSDPIVGITRHGLRAGNEEYELDAIVFAIGFDAITGALLGIDVRGEKGALLREKWAAGPRTYLGLTVAGFPNLFIVTGPGSPSVLSNMVVSIEQHVDWITECLLYMAAHSYSRVEATEEAEEAWGRHVAEIAAGTLYPVANSWYVGANVPGKPRVFMPYVGGCGRYRRECGEIVAAGYRGFEFSFSEERSGLSSPTRR